MLKDAASNAKPTKYAQNKRHGMYEGTLSMMNLAPERCSAPKTAKGMAKHKLLKTTILSRPPARAISVFAAHSATRKSSTPAMPIETTAREISKNVASMVVCMWMPSISPRLLFGRVSPGQCGFALYNKELARIFFLRSWRDTRRDYFRVADE